MLWLSYHHAALQHCTPVLCICPLTVGAPFVLIRSGLRGMQRRIALSGKHWNEQHRSQPIPIYSGPLRRMNPYNLNWEKFTVAVEPVTDAVVGCGQLVPLGNSGSLELRSLIVEPSHRCVTACPDLK